LSCARTTDGVLLCWGDNRYGQLGTSDNEPRSSPTAIRVGGLEVTRVDLPIDFGDPAAALAVFSSAVTADGVLWSWGSNQYGALGTGDVEPSSTPARITDLAAPVARSSGGAGHVCALRSDGSVWCWG